VKPIHLQFCEPAQGVDLYFDTLLHQRASDFHLIRKAWGNVAESKFKEEGYDVLRVVVARLFQPDTGIPKLHVKDYRISADLSQAVSCEYIVEVVVGALTEAGYEIIIGQKPPSQKWLQETAESEINCCPHEPHNKLQKLWWRFFPPSDPYADGEV
jgi:hypothetical protein